ncbi:right-handed parallel beta-helix repeat-containing protein [Paraburkholderia aromaticivorans]|uniref:right-handed parallel beta-helix repeat-containing protein n=1 Tax=Paraburkholderia aromaticivorans TaxID=2026199 RepID=UPI00142DBAB6|nr:right-handed parallel beta-helix repeat-containing protein [Paraburkholderia aromaticivorans]
MSSVSELGTALFVTFRFTPHAGVTCDCTEDYACGDSRRGGQTASDLNFNEPRLNNQPRISLSRRDALKFAAFGLLSVSCAKVRAESTAAAEVAAQTFGVKADGRANDTAMLQRAIDNCVGKVLVISGKPRIDVQGLTLRSGTRIRFDGGAAIKLLPHNTYTYQMVRIWDIHDVEIVGLVLDGSKELNSAANDRRKNGYGMGVSICGSSNVVLTNPVTNNCWGDGIYIANSYTDRDAVCSNVVVKSHYASGCRRQGISLISGRNVRILNPLWENIRGTLPSAGLDIEPNSNRDVLENIVVSDPVTRNCRCGIELWLARIPGAVAKKIDIQINGHQDDGSDNAYIVSALKSKGHVVEGRIVSRHAHWVNTKGVAYLREGIEAPNVVVQIEP